ncbi:MAG: radical SAM protein [Clostridiales bacterium]|nr:radical SAM protein [Clostridiales bacterium]
MKRSFFFVEFCSKSTSNESFDAYFSCHLCPRNCGCDRSVRTGVCGMTDELRISRVGLHMWEEPCISGSSGSGTIFFTGCNLGCVFCQNHEISRRLSDNEKFASSPFALPGRPYTVSELADAMLSLQNQGANNINFVTGTHFVPHIVEGVRLARERGLTVPTLYNCGGYESAETIKMLDGVIDIYLPDMKFFSSGISRKYAHTSDYFERAKEAIAEMVRQCPDQVFDENGLIRKGVIVRHLMLPGQLFDSKHILDYLCETYGNSITISLMNQYTPMPGVPEELNRPLSPEHYRSMIDHLTLLGQENAFIQEGGTVSESFIPDFE